MMLDVSKVKVESDYKLLLEFENGEVRRYDMTSCIDKGGVFAELRDQRYFKLVFIENGTICWPNGQDVCPETLYENGKPVVMRKRKQKEALAV